MSRKPLPANIISMLRGEIDYTSEYEDLAKLSQMYYQDGKDGRLCEFPAPPPNFSADAVKVTVNFLRRCWEQGRQDARKVTIC